MKVLLSFEDNYGGRYKKFVELDIIPRVGDYIACDNFLPKHVFLQWTEGENQECWSGFSLVKCVYLIKDKDEDSFFYEVISACYDE